MYSSLQFILLIVPVICTTRAVSAAKQYVKSLKLKSLLVAKHRLGSSTTRDLMILGLLQLPAVCTL